MVVIMTTINVIFFLFFYILPLNSCRGVEFEANCTMLKEDFANTTSSFTLCAIMNAHPITLCQGCVDNYIDVLNSYKKMHKYKENGTTCIDKFINLDRLQIIQTLYGNAYNLWNQAKCYECFEIVNGSLTKNRSEETIKFDNKYNQLMSCVNRSDIDNTLCETCMDDYLDLNDFYQSISNENEKIGVCMDIVDIMNTTRSMWSRHCCKYRKHKEYTFLISAAIISAITIGFYCLAQFCTEKRTPAILQQTRFAGSLTQMNL